MEVIIAQMYVSPVRRAIGVVLQVAMGITLVFIAAARPPTSPLYIFLLLGIGGILLVGGWRFWKATSLGIVLTDTNIRDTSGTIICKLADIEKIERGTFALKPANGFTLKMTTTQSRSWAPGLWWRMGKMVGIGGATNRNAAKAMAEAIDVLRSPAGAEIIAQARADQP